MDPNSVGGGGGAEGKIKCCRLVSWFLLALLKRGHHIPTNSVALFSAFKHAHTHIHESHHPSLHSDEGLTIETLALKLSTVADYQLRC